MDAPAGTTSAALGGGVNTNAIVANNSNITNTENYGINNNITANATSGNARASNDNNVGSVTSGNATTSVSLANLINSNFSLSNWFGVLFINVFGTWHGNFAVMKPPVVASVTSGSSLPGGMGGGGNIFAGAKVFAFVPTGSNSNTGNTSGMKLAPATLTDNQSTGGGSSNLLSKATAAFGTAHNNKPSSSLPQVAASSFNYWSIGLLALGSAGLGFIAVERVRSSLRNRYITKA
jgi:hypothetical protein